MSTIRQQIIRLLEEAARSPREISQALRIPEKEVAEHLSHIARSVSAQKRKLVTTPARCLECGWVFKNRKRFNRPGRCPHCKSEQIRNPEYQIN